MPSFPEQMERRNSTQSYSSIEGSDMGSQYLLESGFYITSFAATIFIAGLITVGVLFLTLMVTLTVMLQSCQNQSGGLIQIQNRSDLYDYCRLFALHAELNRFEADEFPTRCHAYATQYITEGQYLRDLKLTISMAKSYFSGLVPKDSLDVVLMDIDDIFPSNSTHHTGVLQSQFTQFDESAWVENTKHLANMLILELCTTLRVSGWSLIYITRNPEKQRNTTEESLTCAGYRGWSSLIMRSDEEMEMENWEYFSRKREELRNQGFHIRSVISSQMDALTGPYMGKRFKLAHPIYKFEFRSQDPVTAPITAGTLS